MSIAPPGWVSSAGWNKIRTLPGNSSCNEFYPGDHGNSQACIAAHAAIAAFHVGVEQKWWEGLPSCSGAVDMTKLSPEEMRKMILSGPPARCDQVAWSLFGISMAGYNFLISLAVAAFAFWAAFRRRRPA